MTRTTKDRSRTLAAAVTLLLLAAPAAAAEIELSADLAARALTVWRDGEPASTHRIAVGTEEYPTLRGTFEIRRIVWNPGWVPPDSEWAEDEEPREPGDPDNQMKTAKIFFDQPDYYIHGTDDLESLGDAASHGCLRMHLDEVAELARTLMEAGGESRPDAWYREALEGSDERTVTLEVPIRLRVEG